MKKTVRIDLLSHANHLNQPLTGLYLWAKKQGAKLIVRDCSQGMEYEVKKTALVAYIGDYRLVYDMADGYQSPNAMEYLLNNCDVYFKRSYSEEINKREGYQNIYPYGFNYNVTCFGNLLAKKQMIPNTVLKYINGSLITPNRFEMVPKAMKHQMKILFMVRLWPEEETLSDIENEERRHINHSRVELLRK